MSVGLKSGLLLSYRGLYSSRNDFCPTRPALIVTSVVNFAWKTCAVTSHGQLSDLAVPAADHVFAMCHFDVLQKPVTMAFTRDVSKALQNQLLLTQSRVRSIIMVGFGFVSGIFLMLRKQTQFLWGEIKHLNYSYVELPGLLQRVSKGPSWRLAKG